MHDRSADPGGIAPSVHDRSFNNRDPSPASAEAHMNERADAEALGALTGFLISDSSVGDTLQRVVDIAARGVPPAAFVGITMLDDHEEVTTAVYSDVESPEIDERQYDTGRGPCLDAWRTRTVVRVDDTAGEGMDRYPEFARTCLDHGISSTYSVPLVAGDSSFGAMNLYARSPRAFTVDHESLMSDLGTAASIVLANAVAFWGAYDPGQVLEEAMQSRAVIEQAKGMLMARSADLTADDAFDLLLRASRRENVKLREMALRIVERRPMSGPDPG